MRFTQKVARFSRLGMSAVLLFSVHPSAHAADNVQYMRITSGLLPVERSYIDPDLVNQLFPSDDDKDKDSKPNDRGGNQQQNQQGQNNQGNQNNQQGQNRGNGNGNGNNNGNGNSNGNNNNSNWNRNGSSNNNNSTTANVTIKKAVVDEQFRCNIFENTSYEDVLSAINSLNTAVNSVNCGNSSKIDVKGITDNNAKIADVVAKLRGYIQNPETVQSANGSEIVTSVDSAIRAITAIAGSFAQSDLMSSQCRSQMSAGQIATSISDIMNGLTPYALMAAQFTGGTAAVPFIVGGSIATSAISSIGKIIDENSVKINDPQVRRAIVENTCQFIRLDQRYKFLIKSRTEQMKKISEDISFSQKLFSAQIKDMSSDAQGIVDRKNQLSQVAFKMNSTLSAAQNQLEVDKQFLKMTSDDIQVCSLGVQLATLAQNKSSYISSILGSLDEAMAAYGSADLAQAQALKNTAQFATQTLQSMGQTRFNIDTKFESCAKVTKSFVETIDRAGSTSRQLIKLAQADLDRQLKGNRDLSFVKQTLGDMKDKEMQAERVTGSLDNLRAQANKITQSEIDSEMDRLRRGLLASRSFGTDSPVERWFNYVLGLHKADVEKFQTGLESLRRRAYNLTDSVTKLSAAANAGTMMSKKAIDVKADVALAYQMATFNLKNLPLGTREHEDTCRELQDVRNRWVTAIDHLAAAESFCAMIEPYIYDNRKEDADLVRICRGYGRASGGVYGAADSVLKATKKQLVSANIKGWADFLNAKVKTLVCTETSDSVVLK